MILDSLQNGLKYAAVHPRFAKAFEYLLNNNLEKLPVGKVELEGADLIVNIVDISGKSEAEARMETHRNFIDIQVPVGQTEKMGWKAAAQLSEPTQEYDAVKDLTFYADKATTMLDIRPFEFAVFFPEDGHQPGIATGTYRKIIVKVRV